MRWWQWLQLWLFAPKDEVETAKLVTLVRHARSRSYFQSPADTDEFILDLLKEATEEAEVCAFAPVVQELWHICHGLLEAEAFVFDTDTIPTVVESLDAGVRLRAELRDVLTVLSNEAHYLALWRDKVAVILKGVLADLPVNALVDPGLDGRLAYESVLRPETPLYELTDDLPTVLTKLIGTFADDDVIETPLFAGIRHQFEQRQALASEIPWEDRYTTKRKWLAPWDRPELAPADLVTLYMDQTLFADFFRIPVPVPIPMEVRFEHTHILGGTGHGKTQLLQYLIVDDLRRALRERLSVVILDPDGTLIRTLSKTRLFEAGCLGDRTIFIDPTDAERPIGLNLFDVSDQRDVDPRARETIENNTIELFEYFFDALLGSELTGRQSTLFRYLGLLLMRIPGGNIHTLRELMEDGRQYRPYMEALEGSARAFFETRFFDKSLAGTKQQVLSRLWGVLSNRSLDRVFSARRNTIALDDALERGSIIFVHTAKESLGEEGSAVFARMMVALLGQTLMRRAAIPSAERTPTYLYLDEAEGVVDATLVRLLAQVRKYKGAITIAHQHLDQLAAGARSGVFANTSIKLAGGVSAKDASALAPEYRTKADFILNQRKGEHESTFAIFAKNITLAAMSFSVPFGFAERFERLSAPEYDELLARSRERYGVEPAAPRPEEPTPPEPEAAEPPQAKDEAPPTPELATPTEPIETDSLSIPRKEGGGGARHREIQAMVQTLGEAAGFSVSLEEVILDGDGRADVILRREGFMLCCEISITTTKEHELLNIQKCLRFGADQVWLIVTSGPRQTTLTRFMAPQLSEAEHARFAVRTIDDLSEAFAAFGLRETASGQIVRGYRVRSKQSRAAVGVFLRKSLEALD